MAPADAKGSDIGSPMERVEGSWEDLPRMEALSKDFLFLSLFIINFFSMIWSPYSLTAEMSFPRHNNWPNNIGIPKFAWTINVGYSLEITLKRR